MAWWTNSVMGSDPLLWLDVPFLRAVLILAAFCLLALGIGWLGYPLLQRLVRRTRTRLDDIVLFHTLWPLELTIMGAGVWYAGKALVLSDAFERGLGSVLSTAMVLLWGIVFFRLGTEILSTIARESPNGRVLQPRTLPLFEVAWKTLVSVVTFYVLLVLWHADPTAWLASAGVVGVAVGFAAQETLSNLFGGLVILADTPYKIGDYLRLEDGTRARVVEIGLRSTRLVSVDHVQLVVPNARMAAALVRNESSRHRSLERIGVDVAVGYASDLEGVRNVLQRAAAQLDCLVQDDETLMPQVRFLALGDHGVRVRVYGWIDDPARREVAVDQLVVAVHGSLRAAGIEIPFPKLDVQLPADSVAE